MASKCPPEKVYNPSTKRCVNVTGAAGKALYKSHNQGNVQLDFGDIAKLTAVYGEKTQKLNQKKSPKPVPATIKPTKASPAKLKLTSPVKNNQTQPTAELVKMAKIKTLVNKWKNKAAANVLKKKLADDHGLALYCKNMDVMHLKKPVIDASIGTKIPVKQYPYAKYFDPKHLDQSNFQFTLSYTTAINVQINNYSVRHILLKGFADSFKYFEDSIDMEWLHSINNYISNLSTKDIYTIKGYTFTGDTIANSLMRGKLDNTRFANMLTSTNNLWVQNYWPLYFQAIEHLTKNAGNLDDFLVPNGVGKAEIDMSKQHYFNKYGGINSKMTVNEILKVLVKPEARNSYKYVLLYNIASCLDITKFWIPVIKTYIEDLNRIIYDSPPVKSKMTVYRGVKNDYFLKGKQGKMYTTDSFVSTSLNLASALAFAGPTCCFKRIVLLPGTRALLITGVSKFMNEVEVLLGSKTKFYITNESTKIIKDTSDKCKNASPMIKVTDVVVIQ